MTVRDNTSRQNAREYVRAANGIQASGSPSNTIEGNVLSDNEDSGVTMRSSSNDALVRNNATYDNGDHGIDITRSSSARVIGNTVYRNTTSGINIEGTATGSLIANNVAVDNGINSPRREGNIYVEASSIGGTTADYNLIHLSVQGIVYAWDGQTFASIDDLRAAYPNVEVNGIEADPGFAAAPSGNLRLTAGSPSIDSADSGASGATATDLEDQPRVDDLGVANTGAGPRAYDDRGAYEFQESSPPNTPPVITSGPTATPGTIFSNEQSALAVVANDADGDDLDYQWSVPAGGGTIAGSGANVTYVPPAVTQQEVVTITVVVNDGRGGSDSGTVPVTVDPAPVGSTLSFSPDADTYVNEDDPLDNFGGSSRFDVDASPVQTAYIRFDVSGIVGTVQSAILRLEVTNGSNNGGTVHPVADNSWDESTITFDNAPLIDLATEIAAIGNVSPGDFVDVDLTSAISGDGVYSFAIFGRANNGADYRSKESGTGTPELVITLDP